MMRKEVGGKKAHIPIAPLVRQPMERRWIIQLVRRFQALP